MTAPRILSHQMGLNMELAALGWLHGLVGWKDWQGSPSIVSA